MSATTDRILSKAVDGRRLSYEEGVELMACRDLHKLGRAAHAVCSRLHPEPYRTYNIDRNVNYTNVCAAVCDFCSFYRKSADADAYVTEAFVEDGFGGIDKCTAEQEKVEGELPTDIEVEETNGVDDVGAIVTYEDVGGKFDGEPTQATLYYVDGAWRLYAINPAA